MSNSTFQLHVGDSLEVLRGMPDSSIDSIVTDPPYGLSFMAKKWDYDVPSTEIWSECLRVLKPGGHLLAFAGARTQHRMAVRIEDAGFEIRDMIAWLYGSGFPKSHNGPWGGTALKPALEPITVARKPLVGTVAANFLSHGTGALNIDGCRVATDEVITATRNIALGSSSSGVYGAANTPGVYEQKSGGRWPANVIHDGSEEVFSAFPEAPGQLGPISGSAPSPKTGNVYGAMRREGEPSRDSSNDGAVGFKMKPGARRLDSGSAARFFYCAKASRKDRNDGLDGFVPAATNDGRAVAADNAYQRGKTERANTHPTVKPTDLMAYLCRLFTPSGGTVLDPFMGSGSTGKAAMREGFRFIGVDLSAEYVEIARARIQAELDKIALANQQPAEPEHPDLFSALS